MVAECAMQAGRSPSIGVESPLDPEGRALIADSQAALLEVAAEEEIFSLGPEELAAPNAVFFVARMDGQPAGCVALVDMGRYGEVKRLFVRPAWRGRGIAEALMTAGESLALEIGLTEMRLESSTALAAAARLYRRMGYAECPAFGGYPVLPDSLFMARRLAGPV
ncbi:GNAT family N-acetyltransferase [Mangrovicoccus algicola]|uniref:GNAT family N-acetyltransferase n=1 Tax=Mangrovicoccus algicola TaxID=2771008 RepID=A0A8J6YYP0_9RHOB|nr:GNAT family N-acetyltransferase [Mangrovicoccus algicola]MBE3640397.1 GNAT family N-acetyltransferase [Mangrovicoccus algicola]